MADMPKVVDINPNAKPVHATNIDLVVRTERGLSWDQEEELTVALMAFAVQWCKEKHPDQEVSVTRPDLNLGGL